MAEVLLPWENLSSAIQNTHVISAKHSVMGSYLEPTILSKYVRQWCFAGGSDGKESACNAGDPGSGRSSGEGNGNPLQYSCLENSMDREAWCGSSPWGHKELDMTERLTLWFTEWYKAQIHAHRSTGLKLQSQLKVHEDKMYTILV